MSEGEIMAAFVAGATGLILWLRWLYKAHAPSDLLSPRSSRAPLVLAPFLAAAALFAVLRAFAASDVRDSAVYLAFYMILGAGWVGAATIFFPLYGLRPAADVAQRRNPAAGVLATGAVLGLTLAFAGANIGDGPGWWVVLFSAALSTAGLFTAWALVDWWAGVTDAVTIDRDPAAAVRLGAFLVAAGAIQGRAVAGNWVSGQATILDWAQIGWPTLALVAMEIVVGVLHRAASARERPSVAILGVPPGAVYLAGATGYILSLGWWA